MQLQWMLTFLLGFYTDTDEDIDSLNSETSDTDTGSSDVSDCEVSNDGDIGEEHTLTFHCVF